MAASSASWFDVKFWRTSTRLSKSMICATSTGLRRWTKLMARLQHVDLVFHARAAVQQQRQRDRELPLVEEGDVLPNAVFEHVKVRLVEVRHIMIGGVGDGEGERDHVDAGAEGGSLAILGSTER